MDESFPHIRRSGYCTSFYCCTVVATVVQLRFNVEAEIMGGRQLSYVCIIITLIIVLLNLIIASIYYGSTRPSSLNRPSFGSKSYMLSLHYAEQLTNAVAHYIEFINLVADWNLTGVEPYIRNSRLFGLRYVLPTTSFFKCSLLLNTSSLNTELSGCLKRANDTEKGRPILFEPFSEFLSRSYRHVVTVYFTKHMFILSREIHKAMDSSVNFGDEPICDCTNTARDKGMSQQVEKLLDQELVLERTSNPDRFSFKSKFTVVQAFCVNKSTPISLVQLRDYVLSHIGHDDDGNKLQVSILFISWQGRFTHTFTDPITMNKCRINGAQLVYSDKVLDTANQFIRSLGLLESSYVSVQIRFEHVFMHHLPKGVYQCCMKKLNVLLGMVQQKHNITSKRTLLMKDYGPYGSDTCKYEGAYRPLSLCKEKSSKLLSQLNVTLAEFDPVAFDAPVNSGFVSLVEASSLFSGRALITIGGGAYQGFLVKRFIKWHHNDNPKNIHYHLHCQMSQQTVNELVLSEDICDHNGTQNILLSSTADQQ